MSMKKHDLLVSAIRKICNELELAYFSKSKYSFPPFMPDIAIGVGPGYADKVVIDAITSESSLNRVIGGLYRVKKVRARDVRHCVAVVDSNLVYRIPEMRIRTIRDVKNLDDDIIILQLSELKEWLEKEIVQCAEERIRKHGHKFYYYIKR